MNKFRKLKIYKKFQAREWKYIPVPEIRLEGKWLKELGFEIGKKIEIKQQKNKLIITLTDKKEEKQNQLLNPKPLKFINSKQRILIR